MKYEMKCKVNIYISFYRKRIDNHSIHQNKFWMYKISGSIPDLQFHESRERKGIIWRHQAFKKLWMPWLKCSFDDTWLTHIPIPLFSSWIQGHFSAFFFQLKLQKHSNWEYIPRADIDIIFLLLWMKNIDLSDYFK